MIVRSDVSVYQIFRRFRCRKSEFPGRWTAKPLFHLPISLPFLFFLILFSFPSVSYFFLSSFLEFFIFFISLVFACTFLFLSAVSSELVSCFQFCAGLRQGSAEQHSFVSSTLSSASSKLSYPEFCFNFFFLRRSSILLFSSAAADRRETYSVSISIPSA